ncbi:hypothetical protein SUGI_1196630 [Cryptomeria japonica]|nr:hypothetical protein SUGI_1196630 [Cryptomeria japonica]
MSKGKLVVEVIDAHNLMPKDGQGSASPFVEVDFDNQRFRTQAKQKDLNPVWNQKLVFDIIEPANLHNMTVDVNVYNEKKSSHQRNFLGKVKIVGTSIVRQGEEVLQRFALDKRSIFSHIKGELGLKVYYIEEKGGNNPNSEKKSKEEKSVDDKKEGKQHQQQQQQRQQSSQQQGKVVEEKKAEGKPVTMHATPQPADYALKETNPHLGGGGVNRDKTTSTYDLVEQMQYLYARVVKARDLPGKDITSGSSDPYVEVKLGNYKGTTKHFEKKSNPEWNQVFAFSKERLQSSVLEVVVKDKSFIKDDFIGRVSFDLNEVPTRVPPDSPLAPQWYRLEDKNGESKVKGELMLSVWMGTQADEAFPEAWHSDAAAVHSDGLTNIRSKVYLSPKLWYVRVNVIEAQDLLLCDRGRFPELSVKVKLGNQMMKTRIAQSKTTSPLWNEDLVFVAAEPFEDYLVLSVEDRLGPNKDEILGRTVIPLTAVEKRVDHRIVNSRWFNLEKNIALDGDKKKEKEVKFSSRIHLRVCLDGGYHVLDESTLYSSDLRPTAKQLWKPYIGILEVGILSAQNLLPVKTNNGRGMADTYCVAKYGQKWVRTRTVIDSFSPKWNEQYTWEVYDPCTVITVGVFDNLQIRVPDKATGAKDMRIGKVRIRLSTLETDRVYTHSYPLLMLHNSGVKKMGELQLAVRFSCSSLLECLRYQAINTVAMRLNRAEPPLRREVVEYMLDVDSHMWSMRRSKANFFRIMSVLSGLVSIGKWFDDIRNWKNPITTVLVHILFLILVWYPKLILTTFFGYMCLIGIWHYRFRPRNPPHMDIRLSQADAVSPDELDEEFDTFPTSRNAEIVRMRYDRLRSVAGRIQTVFGDFATQGERFQSLLSWRDPRATTIFITFCFLACALTYVIPFQVLAVLVGVYLLRHPRFRSKLPSVPLNFLRRLPARTDSML